MVQSDTEAQGFNREAYEHSLEICGNRVSTNIPFREETTKPSPTPARVVYILKLERPLNTLQNVQYAAGMIELPASIQGIGEDGDASFCRIKWRRQGGDHKIGFSQTNQIQAYLCPCFPSGEGSLGEFDVSDPGRGHDSPTEPSGRH
jgi:hypothetical protein